MQSIVLATKLATGIQATKFVQQNFIVAISSLEVDTHGAGTAFLKKKFNRLPPESANQR
jgi:hypothetical protein